MGLIEGVVGLWPALRGRNAGGPVGLSRFFSALLAQEAGARYLELVNEGLVFTLSSAPVATPAAGPLGAGGTPILGLWNPLRSGFLVVLLRYGVFTTANGTTSAKAYELDGVGQDATITGTVTQPANNKIGLGADGDIKGYLGAMTGVAAMSKIAWLNAYGSAGAQNTVPMAAEDLQGLYLVPPGVAVAITPYALGVANEVAASLTYAKLPL